MRALLQLSFVCRMGLAIAAGVVGVLFACTSHKAQERDAPSTDIQKLANLVNLPERPQRAIFSLTPMGKADALIGSTDYTLIALLSYDRDALQRLKERAVRVNSAASTGFLPERPHWFPQTLLGGLNPCYSGWCINGEEYEGDSFLKGGYVTGSFIVTEDQQYVILVLGT
jgi:hypothetical protein